MHSGKQDIQKMTALLASNKGYIFWRPSQYKDVVLSV